MKFIGLWNWANFISMSPIFHVFFSFAMLCLFGRCFSVAYLFSWSIIVIIQQFFNLNFYLPCRFQRYTHTFFYAVNYFFGGFSLQWQATKPWKMEWFERKTKEMSTSNTHIDTNTDTYIAAKFMDFFFLNENKNS